jgi:O-acetylhomoserine (thiol)-lyase
VVETESKEKKAGFATGAVHAGQEPDPATRSRAVPVYRTSSFVFRDAAHAARLFCMEEEGSIYTRMGNPTTDVLEKRLAALEGAGGALALASGTAAVFYSIINLAKCGDSIVSANDLYGGTFTQFSSILPSFGITASFADPCDADAVGRALAANPNAKALYCEAMGNPALNVPDFAALAEAAHGNGVPLIVDSTFATPYLLRPAEHGADIIVHSLTKWIGGHGTAIGGAVVDAGSFGWLESGKHPLLTEPDESYHGISWARGPGGVNALAYITRMRQVPLRNLGACISPDNSWIFLQGLETLHARMPIHCANALKVAEFLSSHPEVEWVRYPGLDSHPTRVNAKKYFRNGFGGAVVFSLKGGRKAGQEAIGRLKLFSHLANVGDAKSLAIHPATTTHGQMGDEELRAAGITPGMVRLSVGLEDAGDLVEDLAQALRGA